MIEEIKPFLDEDTIVVNGHKIFGPESNDLNLQLPQKWVSTPSSWLV